MFYLPLKYINAVKTWTTFGGIFGKPEQMTTSFPLVRCDKALDAFTVLEESRTTTISGNKAIAAAPSRDGLTIIIYKSVKGNAQTLPNRIKNIGWIYLGFLTGAEMKNQ
jgi:hypothetical protein